MPQPVHSENTPPLLPPSRRTDQILLDLRRLSAKSDPIAARALVAELRGVEFTSGFREEFATKLSQLSTAVTRELEGAAKVTAELYRGLAGLEPAPAPWHIPKMTAPAEDWAKNRTAPAEAKLVVAIALAEFLGSRKPTTPWMSQLVSGLVNSFDEVESAVRFFGTITSTPGLALTNEFVYPIYRAATEQEKFRASLSESLLRNTEALRRAPELFIPGTLAAAVLPAANTTADQIEARTTAPGESSHLALPATPAEQGAALARAVNGNHESSGGKEFATRIMDAFGHNTAHIDQVLIGFASNSPLGTTIGARVLLHGLSDLPTSEKFAVTATRLANLAGHDVESLDAFRKHAPIAAAKYATRQISRLGNDLIRGLIDGKIPSLQMRALEVDVGLGKPALDRLGELGKAVKRFDKAESQEYAFMRDLLLDDKLTVADKLKAIRVLLEANPQEERKILRLIATANKDDVLVYKSGDQNLWDKLVDRVSPANRPFIVADLPDYPPLRREQLFVESFRLLSGDTRSFSAVIDLLASLDRDPTLTPSWQAAINAATSSKKLNAIADRLLAMDTVSPDLAAEFFRKVRPHEMMRQRVLLASNWKTLTAKAALLLANVHQEPTVQEAWGSATPDATDASELRAKIRHHSIPREETDALIPHQPRALETISRVFLLHVSTPDGLRKFTKAAQRPSFVEHAQQLLGGKETLPRGLVVQLAKQAIAMGATGQVNAVRVQAESDFKIWPAPEGPTKVEKVDPIVAKQSLAIIGGGATAIIVARYRNELGYDPVKTTIFSDRPSLGGTWRQANVLDEGHNTFRSASIFGATLPAVEPRKGEDLSKFLDDLSGAIVPTQVRTATVTGVRFNPTTRHYTVLGRVDGKAAVLGHFDSVFIATGNRRPKELGASRHMSTNAAEFDSLAIERWQRPIKEAEYRTLEGKYPVVVGLGNSAMAMIGEFMKMQAAGAEIHPRILTHFSLGMLTNPSRAVLTEFGRVEGPLYRDASSLHRIAGDIPKIAQRLEHALASGWIVPEVTSWNVNAGDAVTVTVTTRDSAIHTFTPVPRIFALIGYRNDPNFVASLGCKANPQTGELVFDPRSGVVRRDGEDSGRMYVGGAAAATLADRGPEVIPGMMRGIPLAIFSEIVNGES